jgi:hypothetical protein
MEIVAQVRIVARGSRSEQELGLRLSRPSASTRSPFLHLDIRNSLFDIRHWLLQEDIECRMYVSSYPIIRKRTSGSTDMEDWTVKSAYWFTGGMLSGFDR